MFSGGGTALDLHWAQSGSIEGGTPRLRRIWAGPPEAAAKILGLFCSGSADAGGTGPKHHPHPRSGLC